MKHRLLSVLLTVTVMASALAGAMAVSVLPAKADDFPAAGYLDDLFAAAFDDVPSENRVTLEYYQALFDERFDDYLIVVIHDTVLNGWYFAAYDGTNGADPVRWCLNNSSYTPYYTTLLAKYSNNGYYDTACNFIAGCKFQGSSWYSHAGNAMGNTSLSQLVNWSTGWQYLTPNPLYLNMSGYECYSNRDMYKWNNDDPSDSRFMVANLNPGSDVPPVIEYHWFKFNLGDRWYITTYDQSLIANLETGDDTFWVWTMYASKLSDPDNPEYMFIWWPDVQYLSFAETFISQSLINVSSSGVLAYDITDLILDPDYSILGIADFYQVIDTPGGMSLGNLMAESSDVVDLNLSASEENPSQNEAWTVINNYYENYPSVTIAPGELASQLAGSSAFSSGLGKVQIPEQLWIWMNNGTSIREIDSDFHYDLSFNGLDPDDSTLASMINFDILSVAIVASKKTVNDQLIIHPIKMCNWDYRYANDPNDNYTVDVDLLANISYDDLWEMYDLVFIVDPDSPWLLDPDDEFDLSHITSYFYRFGYTGTDVKRGNMAVHELASQYPAYWVLTRSALQKSQLYVFCDGFSKLYDLATQVCNKRDLWDSSFFEWSMSIFWELETVNGHLFAIENEILGWKLSTQFELLFDKLETLSNNIVDPDLSDVDPWYLPLWEWVNRFAPSVNDFTNSIDVMDDTFDELPAIPQVTDPPAIPTLPGFD